MKTQLHNHIESAIRKIENEHDDVLTLAPEFRAKLDFIQLYGNKFDCSKDSNVGGEIGVYMACGSSYKTNHEAVYEKYGYTFDSPTATKIYDWDERGAIADEVVAIVIAIGGEDMANAFMSADEYNEAEKKLIKEQEEYEKKSKKSQIKATIIWTIVLTLAVLTYCYLVS